MPGQTTCPLGAVFAQLTVVAESPHVAGRHRTYSCLCACGTVVLVRGANLRSGNTKRCGRRCPKHPNLKHDRSPTYWTWMAMRRRCRDKNFIAYPFYGALGVTVCDRWYDLRTGYAAFVADVGLRPLGMTLDRKDVRGNYEPGNVQWATRLWQDWNKRSATAAREDAAEMAHWDAEEAAYLASASGGAP